MYIGNTLGKYLNGQLLTVYPYVYREHGFTHVKRMEDGGLSLCI